MRNKVQTPGQRKAPKLLDGNLREVWGKESRSARRRVNLKDRKAFLVAITDFCKTEGIDRRRLADPRAKLTELAILNGEITNLPIELAVAFIHRLGNLAVQKHGTSEKWDKWKSNTPAVWNVVSTPRYGCALSPAAIRDRGFVVDTFKSHALTAGEIPEGETAEQFWRENAPKLPFLLPKSTERPLAMALTEMLVARNVLPKEGSAGVADTLYSCFSDMGDKCANEFAKCLTDSRLNLSEKHIAKGRWECSLAPEESDAGEVSPIWYAFVRAVRQ